jgi:hypothetical protein
MTMDESQRLKKLIELMRETISRDEALRQQYEVGTKFRFVSDKLNILMDHLEKRVRSVEKEIKKAKPDIKENLITLYVYLYNAQGLVLRNWLNMLIPKVFYEYSVNRPIYADKSQIESLIRTKSDKVQHAYITISVNEADIIQSKDESMQRKDALGSPLIRVKEGALHFDKLILFTHNGIEYTLNDEGELIKR